MLQLDIKGLTPHETQGLVHKKIIETAKHSKILFVLDNVPNHSDIKDYIATLRKQFATNIPLHILITSRSQNWQNKPLPLDIFTDEEAYSFVKKNLPDESDESIKKLIARLDYFPLGLSQAVAYIRAHTNIDDYLELYSLKQQDYLDMFHGDQNQYTQTLWKTYNIALAKLPATAKSIISMAAYLFPDDIPISFFDNLTTEERAVAIKELRKHSFVALTNRNKSIRIHRLLQEVIRLSLNNKTKKEILEKTTTMLKEKFNFTYARHNNWSMCEQYLTHAQTLAQHALEIKNNFIDVGFKLLAEAAMYLTYVQADIESAKDAWDKIIKTFGKYYSNDLAYSLGMANIKSHLGFTLRKLDDITLATKYINEAIAIYNTKHNLASPSLNNLLSSLRWDLSIPQKDEITYDYSFALFNLGLVKHDSAELQASQEAYEKGLTILGNSDFINSTIYKASLLDSLGYLYRYYGNTQKAKELLEKSKKTMDSNFANHLEQSYVYLDIANLLYYMGNYDGARENLEKCLQIMLAVHTKDHYRVGYTKSLLGLVLCASNNTEEGLNVLKQAEIIYNNSFEQNHQDFVLLYIYLSYAFEANKEYDKSLQYLNNAHKIAIRHWGKTLSQEVFSYQLTPIEQFPTIENSEKNVSHYKKSLTLTKEAFGAGNIKVARYCYLLGQVFENINDKKQAKEYYKQALHIANNQQFNEDIFIMGNKKNITMIQSKLENL